MLIEQTRVRFNQIRRKKKEVIKLKLKDLDLVRRKFEEKKNIIKRLITFLLLRRRLVSSSFSFIIINNCYFYNYQVKSKE